MESAVQQVCASCGNPLHADGGFCLFCGDILQDAATSQAQPLPVVPVVPLAETPRPLQYAGFWRRVWAASIDLILEALAALLVTLFVDLAMKIFSPQVGLSSITARYATGIAFIGVLTIGAWLYAAFSESSRWRATIGKRIIGLEVVTAKGGQLSFGQATVRHFMKFLSLFTAAVGFMMAAWTKRRQALHDIPSDTLVIRVAEPSLSLLGIHD